MVHLSLLSTKWSDISHFPSSHVRRTDCSDSLRPGLSPFLVQIPRFLSLCPLCKNQNTPNASMLLWNIWLQFYRPFCATLHLPFNIRLMQLFTFSFKMLFCSASIFTYFHASVCCVFLFLYNPNSNNLPWVKIEFALPNCFSIFMHIFLSPTEMWILILNIPCIKRACTTKSPVHVPFMFISLFLYDANSNALFIKKYLC